MGRFKLALLPVLLVAVVAAVAGDELRTFIVHVHPRESHVFGTADDRTAWYRTFVPEDGRLVHSYHHVASGFAARLTERELEALSGMPGFVAAAPNQEVSVIARRSVDCSAITVIPDRMLNYPSISLTLPSTTNPTAPVVVSRAVKNVGEASAVYYPRVNLPGTVQVKVAPSSLRFTAANQVQNFTVSVWRGQRTDAKVVQGSLQWVSDKHTVRSPVSISFA
ncbi:subtilisin-like protease SBT1.7 [Panicum miliaceum]|uniref:Subtilisin-like protease SBT1.7 n=1 Tax=Panicum miliaceum TaxID=4540 RepID=A0A3L6PRU4_PANMI|nr:subtilisin-like protease SBT1.7 [Panicum miliaceum]